MISTYPQRMPISAAICSLPVIAAAFSLPIAAVVVSHPEAPDIYAILGAIVAAIMALIEARLKDRSVSHTLGVFLGTVSVGAIMPGLLFQIARWKGWVAADTLQYVTWHAWAGAGLICGLPAWGLLHLLHRWMIRAGEHFARKAAQRIGLPDDDQTP